MIEVLIVIIIGFVLIFILNSLPEKNHKSNHPIESIKKIFEGFSDKDTDNQTDSVKEEKDKILAEAEGLFKAGKFKKAETKYLEVLKIDDKNVNSYKGLGQICFKQEDYSNAHDVFEKLTKLVPDDASNYCNLGMCCFKENNFSSAVKHYQKALSLDKKGAYYKNLGIVLIKLGKIDEAAKSLLDALSRNKHDASSFKLLFGLLTEIKDKWLLKRVILKLLEIKPDDAVLKRELSRLKAA